MKVRPTEFEFTDGTEVYRATVGRRRGKAPKIRKRRGNVNVMGFAEDEFKADLMKVFGGRKKFFLFGPRKRVKMEMDSVKSNIRRLFSAQSKRYAWPNPVSAGHSGVIIQGKNH